MHPERANDTVVEIVRGGRVVGYIYGSREGIHIVSHTFGEHGENFRSVFLKPVDFGAPGVLVPLLGEQDTCPWCLNTGCVEALDLDVACPICGRSTVKEKKP